MISASLRHRRQEYRVAGQLARRRLELETRDHNAKWYSILSLLAVNWLEPVSDDDLFELYILILTLDVLADDLGMGDPVQYGLVTRGRGYVALFESRGRTVQVFFDQTPSTVLAMKTQYAGVIASHRGLAGGQRRPDIILVSEVGADRRVVLVEMKNSADGRYLSDSVYKVFGYLFDLGLAVADRIRAVLVVPTGVSAASTGSRAAIAVASGDDRPGFAKAIGDALGL